MACCWRMMHCIHLDGVGVPPFSTHPMPSGPSCKMPVACSTDLLSNHPFGQQIAEHSVADWQENGRHLLCLCSVAHGGQIPMDATRSTSSAMAPRSDLAREDATRPMLLPCMAHIRESSSPSLLCIAMLNITRTQKCAITEPSISWTRPLSDFKQLGPSLNEGNGPEKRHPK